MRLRLASAALVAALALALLAVPVAGPAAATPADLHGHVRSGVDPLADYTVTLYVAGGDDGSGPVALGSAVTGVAGAFELAYAAPDDPDAVLYVLAVGPSAAPNPGAVTLASVLGVGSAPTDIVVNERTTVAAAYAMTQFSAATAIAGPAPGLQNAAGMAANLADPATGAVGAVLAASPNGSDTSTLQTFHSLANMVAACVSASGDCTTLFTLATPAGGSAPTSTYAALVDVNRNPSHNAADLFAFAPALPYTPPRVIAPAAWTLALRFVGDGTSLDGPGNMAVDTDGNVWVTNNYGYSPNALIPVCGSDRLMVFTPTGEYRAGSPYTGGGLSGAGFGIDIDPYGDVWVGNYGFAAPMPDCPLDAQPPHNSVSQFRADGTAVSPAAGFTQGGVSWPQGTVSDAHGNIWIANCESDSITYYPNGDPLQARTITDVGLAKPFDIAFDHGGDAFVTSVAGDAVVMLAPDGTPVRPPITGGGLDRPLGITADSDGYQWVANSGFADLPCPTLDGVGSVGGSVTLITPAGDLVSSTPFTGGGLTLPWGITVDGNDNVWVANFGGKRVAVLCGRRVETCPAGLTTGDPISPPEGYAFDGLTRNTGLVVDPSGNVWVANNWKEVPIQANPGGYEMVVYVGVAAPVHRSAPVARSDQPDPRFTG